MRFQFITGIIVFFCMVFSVQVVALSAQQRMDKAAAQGEPIVIHVSVALADNKHQWIVPVPDSIGNGQDERSNLYWGAMYGLKTFMTGTAGWTTCMSLKPGDERIRERLILKKQLIRHGRKVLVYLVADAWDGRYIEKTIIQFLRFNAGADVLEVRVDGETIQAGGMSHLIVYIGHNALMDYAGIKDKVFVNVRAEHDNPVNDAIVLACKSQQYFEKRLRQIGASPLVLTTGLMAPEAYTLNAAIQSWVAGEGTNQVRKAAAQAYNQYQKTGVRASEWLFGVKNK